MVSNAMFLVSRAASALGQNGKRMSPGADAARFAKSLITPRESYRLFSTRFKCVALAVSPLDRRLHPAVFAAVVTSRHIYQIEKSPRDRQSLLIFTLIDVRQR